MTTSPARRWAQAGLLASSAFVTVHAASAGEPATPQPGGQSVTIEQASQALSYGGGNDQYRIELTPNYSEELGFSMRGAVGAYLTDAIALGLIVEYGGNKQAYLGNAGIQFTDALSLVGTIGLLEEKLEFDALDGRERVTQTEYGASLKGDYELGLLSGFELNGYLTHADSGSNSVETGELYGVQLLASLDLTSTTHVQAGGGYEWLQWDDGGEKDTFTFSAEGTQSLGDILSLNGHVKFGASEYVYGGGLALDLSRDSGNTNRLGIDYSYIDGRDGIQDDQRVALNWSYGFSTGPSNTASAEVPDNRPIRPAADVINVATARRLLGDVTRRPSYLPQTVIAKSRNGQTGEIEDCAAAGILVIGSESRIANVFDVIDNPIGPDFVFLEMQSPASPISVKLNDIPLARSTTVWGVSMNNPGPGTHTLDVDGRKCLITANYPA